MMRQYLLLLFTLLFLNISLAAPQPLDSIAAVVNDEVITTSQLEQRMAMARQQLVQQNIKLPAESALRQQVLNMLIDQSLQLQAAKRAGMSITDDQVNQAINNIAQSRNITVSQFFQGAEQAGINKSALIQEIRDQLLMTELQKAAVSSHISVSPAEIDTYLRSVAAQNQGTQYNVQDILIALSDDRTPKQIAAAKQHAQDLITKIKNGADFKALAASESSGQQAMQGGDLGWRTLAELPANFSKVVENLQVGGISQPIVANDGVHILMLAGVRAGQNSLEPAQMRQQVADMLFKRKFNEQLYIWQQQLRDTAYIKVMS